MADPLVPDVPAASSPAVDVPRVEPSDRLANLSEPERLEWRKTGTLPEPKDPAPLADPPPAEAVEDQPASTDASPVAASEPAEPALKAKTKARIEELLASQARERERADRAERALAESQRPRPPQPDARPAAPSPAPAGLVKPDHESFQYGTSDPGYLEALTDYKVAVTLSAERQRYEESQKQLRAREESQRVISAFEARAAEARAKHPDFDVVAMLAPSEIQPGSVADLMVLEDEAGAEILYHLQQPAHAAERRRILALGPREQFKELVLLGHRLTADPAAARSTQAPPPPPVLSTRASPGDPVARALRDHDEGAYIREANAREIAARARK